VLAFRRGIVGELTHAIETRRNRPKETG
jgi:hypothetical protein